MSLIEQLLPILGLVGSGGVLFAWIWGAATKMRGRQAVDEQQAEKLNAITAANETHVSKCDDSHAAAQKALTDVQSRVKLIEATGATKDEINDLKLKIASIDRGKSQ